MSDPHKRGAKTLNHQKTKWAVTYMEKKPRYKLPPHDESGYLVLALLCGVFVLPFAWLVLGLCAVRLAFLWALASAVLFSFLLYLFLAVYAARLNRRYEEALVDIDCPILFSADAALNTAVNVWVEVRLYLCTEGIIFVYLGRERPFIERISGNQLKRYERISANVLRLQSDDGRLYIVDVKCAEQVLAFAREEGWIR